MSSTEDMAAPILVQRPRRELARGLRTHEPEVDMKQRPSMSVLAATILVCAASPAAAQLNLQWIVPASANTAGVGGTYWRTDLSLHNPQAFDLPVVLQFLPTDSDNRVADTLNVTLYPYETFNLWDVLGPDYFAVNGTGSLLVFADWSLPCDPVEDCDFLVTSRTYTVDPVGGVGEYGQTIPGSAPWQGIDWDTLGYAAGILNDGVRFRTNIGVASWVGDWTTVAVDLQDADGTIVSSLSIDVPPFGHVQRRLSTEVEGASLVFWIEDGIDDSLVFGYASIVDELTGDASFQLAQPSPVGFAAVTKQSGGADRRPVPAADPDARGRSVRRDGGSRAAE
jgi:hypothetical protein